MANNTNTSSLAVIKKDVVDVVSNKVEELVAQGQLHLPANYSAANALKSAWLVLQGTTDKADRPVLETCTKDSIANSLLDMVVQGLNPSKKQCYFIPYGPKLICQRSYFGSMHLAKECAGALDIYAEVVYKGDEFEYELRKGRKHITKHVQRLENVDQKNIFAAYCVIEFGDDRPDYTEIMTIDQIRQAWQQGKGYRANGSGTHHSFGDQMCKKTVINRACKALINSSADNNLLLKHVNRADEVTAEQDVEEEIAGNANSEVIDIDPFDEATEEDHEQQDTEATEEPPEKDQPKKESSKPPAKAKKQDKKQQSFEPTGTDPGF